MIFVCVYVLADGMHTYFTSVRKEGKGEGVAESNGGTPGGFCRVSFLFFLFLLVLFVVRWVPLGSSHVFPSSWKVPGQSTWPHAKVLFL